MKLRGSLSNINPEEKMALLIISHDRKLLDGMMKLLAWPIARTKKTLNLN